MGSIAHQDLSGAAQVHSSLQYQSKIITGDLTTPTGLNNAILSHTFNTQNLLNNSNFEVWGAGPSGPPNNWSGIGVREGTIKRFSDYSAKIVISGPAIGGLLQSLHTTGDTGGLDYMKGRRYSFSCWVYSTDTYAAGARITLIIEHQFSTPSNPHQGTGWELLTVSAIIGNTSTYVRARLSVAHLSGTATAYFDGAMFVEGNAPCAWRPRAGEEAAAAGDTIERTFTETAHGFAVKDVVMFDGSNWVKAQADSAVNAESPWVVKSVATDTFVAVWSGYISGLSGLSAGTVYFLDDDTAGLLTTTEPTDINDVSKPMLLALSTTTGIVLNQRGMVVTGGTTYWDEIRDADGDTGIRAEESADEDILRFRTAGVERMTIDENGHIGVGVAPNSSYFFFVQANSPQAIRGYNIQASGNPIGVMGFATGATSGINRGVFALATNGATNYHFQDNAGNYSDATGWHDISDPSRKTLIRTLEPNEFIDMYDILDSIEVKAYRYKSEMITGWEEEKGYIDEFSGIKTDSKPIYGPAEDTPERIGWLANELPDSLSSPDKKGVSGSRMAAFNMVIIKHQKKLIEELKQRIEVLEKI